MFWFWRHTRHNVLFFSQLQLVITVTNVPFEIIGEEEIALNHITVSPGGTDLHF